MIPKLALSLSAAALLALSGTFGSAAAQTAPPASATPVTAYELLVLFGGKTWLWPTGGGYMARDRTFTAWVEEGGARTFGDGRWLVTDAGRLCLEARWGEGKQATSSTTCFQHMQTVDGTIYQRSTDGGDWYVFKHAVENPTDEFNKLTAGNLVPATASN